MKPILLRGAQKFKTFTSDHIEDDRKIADLEAEIARHDGNIDEMRVFILKQIETAKNDAEKMLTALNAKHRENAFIEALKNSTPGMYTVVYQYGQKVTET